MATVEGLRSKIESYMRQKGIVYTVRPDGVFVVPYGTTHVFVGAYPWGEKTVVKLVAPVSLKITKVTPELTRFLVEKNNELLFGKFSLDMKNKAVWYEHALLGDFLDLDELISAIAMVVGTADNYDEQISKMSGGKLAREA